jgi:hypothetical protein
MASDRHRARSFFEARHFYDRSAGGRTIDARHAGSAARLSYQRAISGNFVIGSSKRTAAEVIFFSTKNAPDEANSSRAYQAIENFDWPTLL